MKNSLQYILLFVFTTCLFQVSCKKEPAESIPLVEVEINGVFELMRVSKMAEYIGGQEGFFRAIGQEIKYPPEARENGIAGEVVLEFEVTQTGEVENIVIKEDVGGGCGEEAKRTLEVITQGVSFHPAELNGEPVRVRMEVPITFNLN